MPTLLAAAGEPDIVEKLKKGYKANGKTFKVHPDGYNFLPYFKGEAQEGAARGDLLLRPGRRAERRALERLEGPLRRSSTATSRPASAQVPGWPVHRQPARRPVREGAARVRPVPPLVRGQHLALRAGAGRSSRRSSTTLPEYPVPAGQQPERGGDQLPDAQGRGRAAAHQRDRRTREAGELARRGSRAQVGIPHRSAWPSSASSQMRRCSSAASSASESSTRFSGARERVGPSCERALARARRARRGSSGGGFARTPQERAVQRVHVRVDDRAHEAVALERGPPARAAFVSATLAMRGRASRAAAPSPRACRNSPPRASALAEPHAAREHRERDREHERDRRPASATRSTSGWSTQHGRGPTRCATQRVEAVVAQRVAPARLASLALPRRQATARPDQVQQHEAAVEHHADRREQRRGERLEQHAREQRGRRRRTRARRAARRARAATREHLRQEQEHAASPPNSA